MRGALKMLSRVIVFLLSDCIQSPGNNWLRLQLPLVVALPAELRSSAGGQTVAGLEPATYPFEVTVAFATGEFVVHSDTKNRWGTSGCA
jgi:hypothetical protein